MASEAQCDPLRGTLAASSLPSTEPASSIGNGPLPNDLNAHSASSSTSTPIPYGPCNYRELSFGPQAPCCGCERFYQRAATGDNGDGGSEQDPWCACGHHGCFHSARPEMRVSSQRHGTISVNRDGTMTDAVSSVHLQLMPTGGDGRYQLVAGLSSLRADGQRGGAAGSGSITGGAGQSMTSFMTGETTSRMDTPSFTGYHPPQSQASQLRLAPQELFKSLPRKTRQSPSGSISGSQSALDRISSQSSGRSSNRSNTKAKSQMFTGLGLSVDQIKPSGVRQALDLGNAGPRIGSGVELSGQVVCGSKVMGSPLRNAATSPTMEDEGLQSATEVIPSTTTTPDLEGLDRQIRNALDAEQSIARSLKSAEAAGYLSDNTEDPNGVKSPEAGSEQAPVYLQDLPASLRKLLPQLSAIRGHLTSYPNVSSSLSALAARVDALENASFSHVPPEEIQDKFDYFDARFIEMENRFEDVGRLADDDGSRRSRSGTINHAPHNVDSSFSSHASYSSVDRGTKLSAHALRRLDDVEDRVSSLEALAPPSHSQPWEVEVVVLPWGRDLKGIWYSWDDAGIHTSTSATQESAEWTGTRRRSDSRTNHPLSDGEQSGWSNPMIHIWANHTQEPMSPRACGVNGIAYKRLKSRGFVKNIVLTSPGARDIQTAITAAFPSLTAKLNQEVDHRAGSLAAAASQKIYHGLDAPLIPLRKVHKSSRLLFLSPSEMIASTSWNAEFLASGVMMRARGGQKRLFVTSRHAYTQRDHGVSPGWTWQRLRELPRVRPGAASASSSFAEDQAASHVAEADAKEPCWTYHPGFDAPPSAQSSMSAGFQVLPTVGQPAEDMQPNLPDPVNLEHSMIRPTKRSCSPIRVPISPLSELTVHRQGQMRRTVSVPSAGGLSQLTGSPTKRVIASFETPVLMPAYQISRKRRATGSPEGESGARPWVLTPRRSREPPSPFVLSERAPSDTRSQGTTTMPMSRGTGTPFAYPTPHSGAAFTNRRYDTESIGTAHDPDEVWEGVDEEEMLGADDHDDDEHFDDDQSYSPGLEVEDEIDDFEIGSEEGDEEEQLQAGLESYRLRPDVEKTEEDHMDED